MAEPQDPSAAVPTNPTVGAGSTGPDRSGRWWETPCTGTARRAVGIRGSRDIPDQGSA